MSKELEAFERVWEDCSQLDLDYVSKHNLMDDLREIKKALTDYTQLQQEVIARQETENSLTQWVADLTNELEALKKTPTADEVIKALSEYESYFGKVNYDASTRRFYSDDTICYLGIDYQRTPIIIFEYDLPPHLITMIGKFYESLEGEK